MTYRYDFAPTPLGEALTVFSDEGLVALEIVDDPEAPWILEGIAARLHAVPHADPGAADELAVLLREYFEGAPVRFDEAVRLDWRLAHGFAGIALRTVCTIGWGETESYGEVAIRSGHPGAARAVGTACRLSPFSIVVPVHRVVRADGTVGMYGAHPEHKRFLIDLEAGFRAPGAATGTG